MIISQKYDKPHFGMPSHSLYAAYYLWLYITYGYTIPMVIHYLWLYITYGYTCSGVFMQ